MANEAASNVVDFTRFAALRQLGERALPSASEALVQADSAPERPRQIQVPHTPFYRKPGFWIAAGSALVVGYFLFFAGKDEEGAAPAPFDPDAVEGEDFFRKLEAPRRKKRRRPRAALSAPPPASSEGKPAGAPAQAPTSAAPAAAVKALRKKRAKKEEPKPEAAAAV